VSAAGAAAAWALARAIVPGHDVPLALIAGWAVVFRLWQRSSSDDPARQAYFFAGIVLLIAALVAVVIQ
jgi:hypothetical protein